jgi:uncharacterized protein (UPF0335 family)
MSEVFTREQLLQYITKIENLELEKSNIQQDIKEAFADAKNNGFDVRTLKHVLKLRKMDANKLAEAEALIELYREAVGI